VLEEKASTEMKREQKLEIREIEIKESSVLNIADKSAQINTKTQKCVHHFGYLSTRSSKEKIPEECMMCENIVQCMLRNVTG